jgi:polyferredoxin
VLGKKRETILYGILSRRPSLDYFSVVRIVVGVVFTLAVALLSLTGTLRFDLWGGDHRYLGESLSFIEVTRAFALPFLAVNVVIVIVSRFVGRYLCGFVCPVGSLARIGEWARYHRRNGKRQYLAPATVLVVCLILSGIFTAFWVDPRVFVEGSLTARVVWYGIWLGTTLALFGIVQGLGLMFCRDWCPSGVYFGLLGHNSANGVEFANPSACTDCKACDNVCPMELEPRHMSGGKYRGGKGFYGDGMSNFSNCIRCGDCLIACESIGGKGAEQLPLRMGWLPPDKRDSSQPREGSDVSSADDSSAPGADVDAAQECPENTNRMIQLDEAPSRSWTGTVEDEAPAQDSS